MVYLNIFQKQRDWGMRMRIIIQLCICMGKVLRRRRKRKFIIWKRLPTQSLRKREEIFDVEGSDASVSDLPTTSQ